MGVGLDVRRQWMSMSSRVVFWSSLVVARPGKKHSTGVFFGGPVGGVNCCLFLVFLEQRCSELRRANVRLRAWRNVRFGLPLFKRLIVRANRA